MKKRSFIRNLSIMLFMQFVLLTALFVALIVHMRNSAVTEMETAADNVLAIYRVNLENRIERANNILKNLTLSEETALEMIRSDKESDRYYAKKSIYTAMHAALLQDNAVDLLIVAENSSLTIDNYYSALVNHDFYGQDRSAGSKKPKTYDYSLCEDTL